MSQHGFSVMFVGGGTLGPVTPLLAVAKKIREMRPDIGLVWVGTPDGPERALMEIANIPFYSVPVAKWPRYVSIEWILFPWRWMKARAVADELVAKIKPLAVVTVGGFTATPVVFSAYSRGVPCMTHQLDVIPGLANASIAKKCVSVTTSFPYHDQPFGEEIQSEQIATPVRYTSESLPERTWACEKLGLDPGKHVTVILGGGTGSLAINEAVWSSMDELLSVTQIVHITGPGKGDGAKAFRARKNYVSMELVEDMREAYAVADLVVCRAGLGTLSELASLSLPSVVIPIPHSHQEANARAFEQEEACVVVHQTASFARELTQAIRTAFQDEVRLFHMGDRAHRVLPTDDGTELARRVLHHILITKPSQM